MSSSYTSLLEAKTWVFLVDLNKKIGHLIRYIHNTFKEYRGQLSDAKRKVISISVIILLLPVK